MGAAVNVIGSNAKKNFILNGMFEHWQRNNGTAGPFTDTTTRDHKGPDRFRTRYDAINTLTVAAWARLQDSPLVTTGLAVSSSPSCYRWIYRRNATAAHIGIISQRIESIYSKELYQDNAGLKMSVSFYVKSSTTNSARLTIVSPTVQDNYASTNTVLAATTVGFTADGTWRLVKFENIPVPVGAILGLDFIVELVSPVAGGLDGADQDVRFTMMMVNKGATALPFEQAAKTSAQELRLCQRYYVTTYDTGGTPGTGGASGGLATDYAFNTATQNLVVNWKFPARMRAAPVSAIYNPSSGALNTWRDTGGADITMQTQNTSQLNMWAINTSSITQGRYASGHFTADAEI